MRPKLKVVAGSAAREMQKVSRSRNPGGRQTDKDYGRDKQKYLTPAQVEALIKAAKAGRHGQRDALMVSLAYHHALRVTELIGLRWDMIDLTGGTINISRKKGGASGPQHLAADDRRTLRRLRKASGGDHVFLSERGDPLTRDAFAKQLAAIGERAQIDRSLCHPHALRHAAGHALANSGKVNAYQLQAIMGHKDGRSTSIYVQGVVGLIKGLWD
jgi:type 1 fimbriae regulatory protein FimB/type 1 fimbriae regulatory protein FimE